MKKVFNNSEVAHVWAQQNQKTGRNSNHSFSFDEKSIYSYSTEMARFIDKDIVLINCRQYSVTTSQHVSLIYAALSSWIHKIEVPYVDISFQSNIETNYRWIANNIQEEAEKLFTCNFANMQWQKEKIAKNVNWFNAYRKAVKTKPPEEYIKYIFGQDVTFSKIIHAVLTEQEIEKLEKREKRGKKAKIRKEKKMIKDAIIEIECLIDFCKNNSLSYPIKTYSNSSDYQFLSDYIGCLRNIKAEFENQKVIAEWKNHEKQNLWNTYTPYQFLRVSKDAKKIETSKNVKIDIKEAKILFARIQKGKPVHGFKVGQYYTVNSFVDGVLTAGCHKIKIEEINEIAKKLEWI